MGRSPSPKPKAMMPPVEVPVIKSKYRRVWLIGRTLAGDLDDQKVAYRLMNKYKLTKPNGKKHPLPADCFRGKGEPANYPTPTDGPGFITSLNRAMAKNPFMSLWLSAANSWAGAARGFWTAETRRQLRLELQKEVIDSNGEIIDEFAKVAEV